MSIRIPISIAICLAAAPVLAQAPPDVAGERVRRDLGAIFQPGASLEVVSNGIDQVAARGHLLTRAYATPVAGMCRRDEVILDYAGPVPAGASAAENQMEPYGVSARSWFRVVRELRLGINRERPFEGDCGRLDGAETRGWFIAPNDAVAADGYLAFSALLRQAVDPHHRIAGCRESPEARRHCLTYFPPSAWDAVRAVDRCASARYHFCFTFDMIDGNTVTVRLRYDSRAEHRIESVDIEYPPISVSAR